MHHQPPTLLLVPAPCGSPQAGLGAGGAEGGQPACTPFTLLGTGQPHSAPTGSCAGPGRASGFLMPGEEGRGGPGMVAAEGRGRMWPTRLVASGCPQPPHQDLILFPWARHLQFTAPLHLTGIGELSLPRTCPTGLGQGHPRTGRMRAAAPWARRSAGQLGAHAATHGHKHFSCTQLAAHALTHPRHRAHLCCLPALWGHPRSRDRPRPCTQNPRAAPTHVVPPSPSRPQPPQHGAEQRAAANLR